MTVKGTASASGVVLVRQDRLPHDERAAVAHLLVECNATEGLDLKVELAGPAGPETGHGSADIGLHDPDAVVYRLDGRIVGYCSLDGLGRPQPEVCGMVDLAYRRRGIGRLLLAAALDECVRRGGTAVLLVCETASVSGRGFVTAAGARLTFSERRLYLDLPAYSTLAGGAAHPASEPDMRLERIGADDDDGAEFFVRVQAEAFGASEHEMGERFMPGLRDPAQHHYLARLGSEPVGVVRPVLTNHVALLYSFGVLPRYQRRGYGRRILRGVIDLLLSDGYTRIGLEVETHNDGASGLYESCGFREVTTYGYYDLVPPAGTAGHPLVPETAR